MVLEEVEHVGAVVLRDEREHEASGLRVEQFLLQRPVVVGDHDVEADLAEDSTVERLVEIDGEQFDGGSAGGGQPGESELTGQRSEAGRREHRTRALRRVAVDERRIVERADLVTVDRDGQRRRPRGSHDDRDDEVAGRVAQPVGPLGEPFIERSVVEREAIAFEHDHLDLAVGGCEVGERERVVVAGHDGLGSKVGEAQEELEWGEEVLDRRVAPEAHGHAPGRFGSRPEMATHRHARGE